MLGEPATYAALAALALGAVTTGWLLYPLAMRLRRGRQLRVADVHGPRSLACVIATREPPDVVRERVADVAACGAVASAAGRPLPLEVVVALDRDAATGDAEYAAALGRAARVVRARDAPGKAAALNVGIAAARADVVVLTDSAQRFAPGALAALAACFEASDVGAASGRLRLPHDEGGGSILGAFWRYELALRREESRVHSLVAVTGAVYAIRRPLWPRLPAGLICDDLYVPLHVARMGFRVVHCEHAHAVDPRVFTREQELARKVRTLTGMLQVCAWAPWVLLPWRNPVWLAFVCHKLLRLATPLLLLVALLSAVVALALGGWLEPVARVAILAVGVPLIVLDLARPRLLRALLARGELAVRLLGSPLLALRRAARRDWNVWAREEAPLRVRR